MTGAFAGERHVIELRGIKKVYRIGSNRLEVLRGVDLEIEEGEFVALMGPSGSGKSTLMHIMGLLDRPSAGTCRILKRNTSPLSDSELAYLRARTIGFVFQQFNLLPRATALENAGLPLIYVRAANRKERAAEQLENVGLSDRAGHRPNELSGGQQQRVAIARALINNPGIILADEPTGNLASDQSLEILNIFKRLNETGITVVMVTHEPDVANWARRVIHIKDGMITGDERKEKTGQAAIRRGQALSHVPSPLRHAGSFFMTPAELLEHFVSAFKSMSANKGRSFLTMLGVIIGVSALIAMLALGKGAQKSIEQHLASLGSNLLMLRPGSRRMHGVGMGRGDVSRLTIDDARAIKESSKLISRVDPNVSGNAQVAYGSKNTNTSILGTTADYAPMHNSQAYFGRFFSQNDDLGLKKVAVIGQTIVNDLFGGKNPVGKTIKINRRNFKVIGVLPAKGAGGFRDQDDVVIIPLHTAMKRALGRRYVNMIWIEVRDSLRMEEVQKHIHTLMRKRHRLGDSRDDDFGIRNMADIQEAVTGTVKTFGLLLGIIAGISLLVGGIGIMNIMLVSVSERTREIGLRKAIGATRIAILAQFIIEAASLSVIGGVIGILLGISSAVMLSKAASWMVVVSPASVILAFTFSAGVGIVFGFWPARKASLLAPIEALRYE